MTLPIDDYLCRYGTQLAENAKQSTNPLHDPETDPDHPKQQEMMRAPYAPQASVISASVKALKTQKSLIVVGECGTGKTILSMGIVHCHAKADYNALIFCPGQLVNKWEREIRETIPNATVVQILSCTDLPAIKANRKNYSGPTWFIISRDTAKLGPKRESGAVIKHGKPHCPHCAELVTKNTKEGVVKGHWTPDSIKKNRRKCEFCHAPLWTASNDLRRFEPAKYIHKQMKGFFDYLIIDELHEEKSANSAQAIAAGSLIASAKKVLGLTGTLIGGYAEHIRPLLFRLCPHSLLAEGFTWSEVTRFNEIYGRIETVKTTRYDGGSNSQSRGSSQSTVKYCRPGIMPTLFGAHLIGNTVFVGLEDMGTDLPNLDEQAIGVEMSPIMKLEYDNIETRLRDKMKVMLARKDKRLLATFLNTLLCYPDHPFNWNDVGYRDRDNGTFTAVVKPRSLDPNVIFPKEQKLLDICRQEKALGRQTWVYAIYNGAHDVEGRLERLLRMRGLNVGVLKSSVKLKDREEWISDNCKDIDVVISHPRLVETGLDLFDKETLGHNFSTLVFYETGYMLNTMRQASRRSWRLRQPKDCKVYYLYYEGTMQSRAMSLMGKKLAAAEAIEGKFSSEGLIALSGDDGMEMELAKSLAERIEEDSVNAAWQPEQAITVEEELVIM